MAMHQPAQFLVCYDISDPKRLQRIHRALKKEGFPIQYSVFSVVMSQAKISLFMQRLALLMDQHEDDLRCYRLPADMQCATLGRQMFPDDVMLVAKGVPQFMWPTNV